MVLMLGLIDVWGTFCPTYTRIWKMSAYWNKPVNMSTNMSNMGSLPTTASTEVQHRVTGQCRVRWLRLRSYNYNYKELFRHGLCNIAEFICLLKWCLFVIHTLTVYINVPYDCSQTWQDIYGKSHNTLMIFGTWCSRGSWEGEGSGVLQM